MGGTQLGTSFRNTKQIMIKNNQSRSRLPQIALKDQSGFLYTTREDQKLMQTYMHNNQRDRSAPLSVMNMTFNSRPGVKQYINTVVKKGSVIGNQLPKQGQRQNKHNGYNNFYFSSQKRGTLQRFNMLDTEKKTKVQHTLLLEAEK